MSQIINISLNKMRRNYECYMNKKQKPTKCSISSYRGNSNSSSIFSQIRIHLSKINRKQQKQRQQNEQKNQNIHKSIKEKGKINPSYDIKEGKKIKSFVNNYIQNKKNNVYEEKDKITKVSERILQNTPKRVYSAQKQEISKKDFTYNYIIGKGGFGKVWKVEHVKNKKKYAMKQMLKSIVLTKKSIQSILNQQKILTTLFSNFIVNIHYAFQDRQTLYLVLDLMEGGDLRHHINKTRFTETQTKFIIACLILGLQYIHKNNIIHRDIKPENIVLDSKGYLKITDFGIARVYRSENSSDTSGTPGYMSPEVICRQNHSFISDYFAIGVIAYELMIGKRPYSGYSRSQIRENMLAKQASIKPYQVPRNWSMESIDFINRLLMRKPQQRLGSRTIQQLKKHAWLSDLNWSRIQRQQLESPFIPIMQKSDFDQDEKITIQDQQEGQLIEKNALLLRRQEFQDLFKQYSYIINKQKIGLMNKSKNKAYQRRKQDEKCQYLYLGSKNRIKQRSNFHNYTQGNSRNSLNASKNINFNVQNFLFFKHQK